ncbi:MAG: hypothetical protein PHW74_00765 [Desulfobacca sp.]|nr:hypothetical protein [Desulfobacca sp.]
MEQEKIKREFEAKVLDSLQTLPDGTKVFKFEDGTEYRTTEGSLPEEWTIKLRPTKQPPHDFVRFSVSRHRPSWKSPENKETDLPGKNMKPENTPDGSHFEKYIDARFAHIDSAIGDIKADMRDIHSGIRGLRSWIISTAIVIFATIIALFTYHATTIQTQMYLFSDYVKAITQPVLPETKVPDKK